jgi:hypothetical protein
MNTNETSIFTKEQFLAIRASWKKFIADGRHKKYKVDTHFNEWIWGGEKAKQVSGYRWESDLKAIHHYVYALIRKRDPSVIFSEGALVDVRQRINFLRHRSSESDMEKFIKPLLAPFGEGFTFEAFKELTV